MPSCAHGTNSLCLQPRTDVGAWQQWRMAAGRATASALMPPQPAPQTRSALCPPHLQVLIVILAAAGRGVAGEREQVRGVGARGKAWGRASVKGRTAVVRWQTSTQQGTRASLQLSRPRLFDRRPGPFGRHTACQASTAAAQQAAPLPFNTQPAARGAGSPVGVVVGRLLVGLVHVREELRGRGWGWK